MNILLPLPAGIERIDILRHGEVEGGARFTGSLDMPLTNIGWQQMRDSILQTAQDWDLILSSPLSRCHDFADDLAQQLDIPCQILSRFQEYHFGCWEGKSAQDIMQRDAESLSRFWQDPEQCAPAGAEKLTDFQQRVLLEWNNLDQYRGFDKILLITHAGVMRVLYCHFKNQPLANLLQTEFAHASRMQVQHAYAVEPIESAAASCYDPLP